MLACYRSNRMDQMTREHVENLRSQDRDLQNKAFFYEAI